MEMIQVGYRQLVPGGYYHKFIVYTDSWGYQWATSAWSEKTPNDVKYSDLFSPNGSSGSNSSPNDPSSNDYGNITVTGGASAPRKYDSSYPDHPLKHSKQNYEWETIKTGSNLSGDIEILLL